MNEDKIVYGGLHKPNAVSVSFTYGACYYKTYRNFQRYLRTTRTFLMNLLNLVALLELFLKTALGNAFKVSYNSYLKENRQEL